MAAVIMALSNGLHSNVEVNGEDGSCNHNARLQHAIEFGCKVAGAKCGMHGYDGLKEMFAAREEI